MCLTACRGRVQGLALGAAAVNDLGLSNLSPWPKPVESNELRIEGLLICSPSPAAHPSPYALHARCMRAACALHACCITPQVSTASAGTQCTRATSTVRGQTPCSPAAPAASHRLREPPAYPRRLSGKPRLHAAALWCLPDAAELRPSSGRAQAELRPSSPPVAAQVPPHVQFRPQLGHPFVREATAGQHVGSACLVRVAPQLGSRLQHHPM